MSGRIVLRGAREHNLRGVDLELPRGLLVAVSGVSGSGKSSLAFDTLHREGQRRYLETYSGHARQFFGQLERPDCEELTGLPVALAVDARGLAPNPRATVGTTSGAWDLLRLLFACAGEPRHEARDFSFNVAAGACPACQGLGVEDRLDPALLVADPARSLRDGALAVSTPNGYLMYSQVTLEVLDEVCRAHDFSVDQPWQELSAEQQAVVLYGSDRIEVPFGKHPLANRLKWSGITARPRPTGTYRGIVPTMEQILARDRNPRILRFVRSGPCRACGGSRLGEAARGVRLAGRSIAELAALPVDELAAWARGLAPQRLPAGAVTPLEGLNERLERLVELGLGHLPLGRGAQAVSGGEAQRLKLVAQLGGGLQGLLYVLDEPSRGMHPRDQAALLATLRRLRDAGNTVLLVEHAPLLLRGAEWVVDLGPGPGPQGGELLYDGPMAGFVAAQDPGEGGLAPGLASPTRQALRGELRLSVPARRRAGTGTLWLRGAAARNLRAVDVPFALGALNAVTGVAGAGKSSLVMHTLGPALERLLGGAAVAEPHRGLEGAAAVDRVIALDSAPIGRNPRSNPATYTGLFDGIRACFAALPEAQARGFGRGRFSFNVAGGRCETCQGAGLLSVGMHFLPNEEVPCPDCAGRRFDPETLALRYRDHDIAQVLALPVSRALELFAGVEAVARPLQTLADLGLGYLPLGQPATRVSGGEAQRIRLAQQLARPQRGHTLYVLDEPSAGLALADLPPLAHALHRLVDQGNTVVIIEHRMELVWQADRVLDLGPGGGRQGGQLVAWGSPEEVAASGSGATARALQEVAAAPAPPAAAVGPEALALGPTAEPPLRLWGARTHNLQDVDLELPFEGLTVVTGPSGSGKSSLVFHTLHAEAQRRFTESLSSHARRALERLPRPPLDAVAGLRPTLALQQRGPRHAAPRSTVGTAAGVQDLLRLLFSRFATAECPHCGDALVGARCARPGCSGEAGPRPSLRSLSFNRPEGACPACGGLGSALRCDPALLVRQPERSLFDGALDGHPLGDYLGERHGRTLATLAAAAAAEGLDCRAPFVALSPAARALALSGAPGATYRVHWEFERSGRRGSEEFDAPWPGLVALVAEHWERKHAQKGGERIRELLRAEPCPACGGSRLRPEALRLRYGGWTLADAGAASLAAALDWTRRALDGGAGPAAGTLARLVQRLEGLVALGLGYLSLDRGVDTLSSGELQRVRLAAQLEGGTCSLCYVLDEPSLGLHARDRRALLAALQRLAAAGNAVVVVEHDEQICRGADRLLELGPGAGAQGGKVLALASPQDLARRRDTATGRWLAGETLPPPAARRPLGPPLRLHGATAHNLKSLDLELPTGCLLALAGVSGSGKTSLAFDVLEASAQAGQARGCRGIEGLDRFEAVLGVAQGPLAGGPHSVPATVTGLLDPLRKLFAAQPAAKAAGLGPAAFSFAGKAGACPACKGLGEQRVGLDFLGEQAVPCELCQGRRYRPEVLAVRALGLAMDEVLALEAAEAARVFARERSLAPKLALFSELGLGHLRLGQPLPGLSGGESQRLRLLAELLRAGGRGRRPRLYLLDEPSSGLHAADLERLAALLHRLVDAGDTVLLVEHRLELLAQADWVLELGPEGGAAGGERVFAGRPEDLARQDTPTGLELRRWGRI